MGDWRLNKPLDEKVAAEQAGWSRALRNDGPITFFWILFSLEFVQVDLLNRVPTEGQLNASIPSSGLSKWRLSNFELT